MRQQFAHLRDGIIGEECDMIELFLGPNTWDELVPDARKNLFGNRKDYGFS